MFTSVKNETGQERRAPLPLSLDDWYTKRDLPLLVGREGDRPPEPNGGVSAHPHPDGSLCRFFALRSGFTFAPVARFLILLLWLNERFQMCWRSPMSHWS